MILSLEQLRRDYKVYRKKDQEVAARIDILLSYSKFELKYQGPELQETKIKFMKAFLTSMEITDRTIQRWKKDYRERGPDGLGKLKATGRPPVAIRRRIRKVITAYRKMYRWGSETIQAHLNVDLNYKVSRHKIEKFLDDSGLRDRYPCTTKKRQKSQKKKKHTKVVIVLNPGQHTQMDVKYQLHLLTNKSKAYVYNFIDHASNWSFKYAYDRINAKNTEDFMNRVKWACPFKIERLQTDNGVEFTSKYLCVSKDPEDHLLDQFCKEHEINHKLIPPGEKELQGLVERSHRQDDQELFSRINPLDLAEFNEHLKIFRDERNRRRRFKKLNWKTPDEWLENYVVVNMAIKLILEEKDVRNREKAVTICKLAA
ncbi:MAG: transposase [Colwellia sp.]|nr:transposase [Colwellia sp.]